MGILAVYPTSPGFESFVVFDNSLFVQFYTLSFFPSISLRYKLKIPDFFSTLTGHEYSCSIFPNISCCFIMSQSLMSDSLKGKKEKNEEGKGASLLNTMKVIQSEKGVLATMGEGTTTCPPASLSASSVLSTCNQQSIVP